MFLYLFTLPVLLVPTLQVEETTRESEKLTIIKVDDITFMARSAQFRSDAGLRTCVLEGDARVEIGDIAITADSIRCEGRGNLVSCVGTGNCTWQQDDGSGEVYSGDQLEFQSDGLQLIGNASLRYGAGEHATEIRCESITVKLGTECFEFSGTVQLRRGK